MERDVNEILMRGSGALIRGLRERRSMTQRDLGARVGVSRSQITRIENGDNPVTLVLLFRIANTLGATILDVLPLEALREPPAINALEATPEELCTILVRLLAQTDQVVARLCGMQSVERR